MESKKQHDPRKNAGEWRFSMKIFKWLFGDITDEPVFGRKVSDETRQYQGMRTRFAENYRPYNPIPKGYQIYLNYNEIAGLHHYKDAAIAFVLTEEKKWLEFQREKGNAYDTNAIEVIGCVEVDGEVYRQKLGYLKKKLAKLIVKHDLFESIGARLTGANYNSSLGTQRTYVDIYFDIVGVGDRKREVDNLLERVGFFKPEFNYSTG